ncbi:MAG TPA: hypothetical protein VME21_02290, partial [Steroidobacteraceae bacterium]|nr:hypothetical protein [Steroidobacteraceae bacterium]
MSQPPRVELADASPTHPLGTVGAPCRRAWWRVAAAWLLLGALIGSAAPLAYELALARVPQYRATLEQLVRARTGLDVRFNELGLRWGWYGPEAVFRPVELGDDRRGAVLLRAAELVVGLDAWSTLQSGQLQAGRITLVAPNLDLAALLPAEREAAMTAASGRVAPGHGVPRAFWAEGSSGAEWLEHWPSGRIDIEDGTLSLPDPAAPGHDLLLSVRHGTLRHHDHSWSAAASAWLPERLGRTARITLELQGDPRAGLGGRLRFQGNGLQLSSWRALALPRWGLEGYLPAAGAADASVELNWRAGRLATVGGELHSAGLLFRAGGIDGDELHVQQLDTRWQLTRTPGGWRFYASPLSLGDAHRAHAAPGSLVLEVSRQGGRWRGELHRLPLELLT